MENAFYKFMCAMDLDEFNVIRGSTVGASLEPVHIKLLQNDNKYDIINI